MLDPSPRVKNTNPLPEFRMAAQNETKGPHRSSILLFGKTGVSPGTPWVDGTVACRVMSEPSLIYAVDEVELVINTASPLPPS